MMMNTVLICALLLSKPYLQNVGTNGFSVCAETSRADRGLRLKWWTRAGRTNETAFVYSLADFSKTFKAVARVEGVPQGCKVGFEVAGERGEVTVWRDCDDDFTCAIYGDFQGGTWAGDPWWGWEKDPFLCGQRMFEDMVAGGCDFAVGTGDTADTGDYEKEMKPLILERNCGILGSKIPFFMAFGNHDTMHPENHFFFENPTKSSFAFFKNKCLFICIDDAEVGNDKISGSQELRKKVEGILKSEEARKAKFRFVFQHVPAYVEQMGNCNRWLLDLYEKYGVDCIFSGDHHGYERIVRGKTRQVVCGCMGFFEREDPSRKLYVNWYGDETKAGGRISNPRLEWRYQKAGERGVLGPKGPACGACMPGYATLSVKGDTATWTLIGFNADGSKIGPVDSFSMKSGERPSEPRGMAMERYAARRNDAGKWLLKYTLTGKGGRVFVKYEDEEFSRSTPIIEKDVVGVCLENSAGKKVTYRLLPDNTLDVSTHEPVRHWAVDPMSDVMRLPDKEPEDGVLGGTVRITMAKGEYEPGSFVVQATDGQGKVRFAPGEFRTKDGKLLPASAIDLKFVKVWYQNLNAWHSYFGDTGGFRLCPELLVNDEDLIRVDVARTNNFARLVEGDGRVHEQWINPPREIDTRAIGYGAGGDTQVFMPMKANFRDAETLQPVALPKGECKQFILTVHTTPDTPEGTYQGEVLMTRADGVSLGRIPVAVTVLPFKLPRPKTWVRPDEDYLNCSYSYISFWHIERLNGGDRALTLKQFEAILRDQAQHGQDMHWIRASVNPDDPEDTYEALWTIDAMKRAGQRTDVIVLNANPRLARLKKGAKPYARNDYHTNAVEIVRQLDAAIGHHNVYTGCGDEPGPKWLREMRPLFEGCEDAGLKFILAGWESVFTCNAHAMDWHNVGTAPEDGRVPTKWNVLGKKTGWYSHLHVGPENPSTNRRQYGLLPYFAGFTANCNYAHHLGGYNDDTVTYRQMNFVYGTGDGVLDTIQWEGFREGVDDIRYATLLRRMADAAKDSADGETRRTALRALAYMANVKADGDDLSAVRSRFVDYILALRSRGVKVPEDAPLATCRDITVPNPPVKATPKTEPRMWAALEERWMGGRFAEGCDYFNARCAREKGVPLRHATEYRFALYLALCAGRAEMADGLVRVVAENPAKFAVPEIYEMRLTRDAMRLGDGSHMAKELAAMEAGLAVGVDGKSRVNALEHVGSLALRAGNEALARAIWEYRNSLVRHDERKHYRVRWSDRPILGPDSWEGLEVEETALDRKYQGSLEFLTTDVSTGDRGVSSEGVKKRGEDVKLTFAAVADEWGLHFRFTDFNEDAEALGFGEDGDGSYEMYIAPAEDAPYTCLLWGMRLDAQCATWNCAYDHAGFRSFQKDDLSKIRSRVVFRKGRIEGFLDLAWKTWFANLPADGSSYEFEVMRWGRHSGAWNGAKSIHGRSTWGRLDFTLTDAQRAAIIRRVLIAAKIAAPIRKVSDYWSDPELGDKVFFETTVQETAKDLESELNAVSSEMSDSDVLENGERLIRKAFDFRYTIDRLRTQWCSGERARR